MNEIAAIRMQALLLLHEFLLEQLFANAMLSQRDGKKAWEELSAQIIDKVRFHAFSAEDFQEQVQLQSEMLLFAENFCQKVKRRISEKN